MEVFFKVDENGNIIDTVTSDYFNEERVFDESFYVTPYSSDERFFKPKYDFQLGKFVEGESINNILASIKEIKISELNGICDLKIEEGFTSSNGHHYRTNRDDQVNMIGQKDELDANLLITEVAWKTEDVGYIIHPRLEWLQVYREAFAHKETQLYKYNELKQKVLLCISVAEVESIQWDSEEGESDVSTI
jgi:hypothetical protein